MIQVLTRTALALLGALLGAIGGALLLSPKAFLEMSHVFIDNDPGLLSELTASSGMLALIGGLMILGSIKLRFAKLALLAGAVVYGSYGISRLISMVLHGLPSQSLITATILELAVAAVLAALRMCAQRQRLITPAP